RLGARVDHRLRLLRWRRHRRRQPDEVPAGDPARHRTANAGRLPDHLAWQPSLARPDAGDRTADHLRRTVDPEGDRTMTSGKASRDSREAKAAERRRAAAKAESRRRNGIITAVVAVVVLVIVGAYVLIQNE